MLKDSFPNRLFIRTVICVLQWIGPLCAGYSAWCAIHFGSQWPINTAWRLYCAAEAIWYLFMVWYIGHLQRKAKHPQPRSRVERQALFNKVLTEIHNPQQFLRGWFKGSHVDDIGRDEVKTFVNWAFWNGEASEKDADEVELYVRSMERRIGRAFPNGRGEARCLRLTVDPIVMETRSLLWYGIIMLGDTISFIRLRGKAFQYHKTWATSVTVFPPRPAAMIGATDVSVSKMLSYWLRPHHSNTRLPVLFIHGIGIGLLSQVDFLCQLDEALNAGHGSDDQVGILALEVLPVSSRLGQSVLPRDQFRVEVRSILDYYGWNRFVLVCHSYGSILSTHIYTDDNISSRISATLMADPVTILLHMPDVAYNFTVRPPRTASEWQLWYFASTDPGVASTLGRHLFWNETVLWRDRIMELMDKYKIRFTVSLASEDLIVETNAVGNYLTYGVRPDPVMNNEADGTQGMTLQGSVPNDEWKRRKWSGNGLDIIWWQGYDHAQCFDEAEDRTKLVAVIVEYCKGS